MLHTFSILSDEHDVDVVVTSLDADAGLDVQDVDEQVESVSQLHVTGLQV